MKEADKQAQTYFILGQKYAYATVSLVLGLFSFIHLLGLEKAVLAIIFGWLALKSTLPPKLEQRRLWAKTGLTLGLTMLVVVPFLLFFVVGINGILAIIDALEKLSRGK
jgi:hypothetical protein